MLKLHGEGALRLAVFFPEGVRHAQQQHVADKIEHRRVGRRVLALRARDGQFNGGPVSFGHAVVVDIGPVHGKTGDDLADGVGETAEGKIPRVTALLGQTVELMREYVNLTRQGYLHDQFLTVIDQLRELAAGTGEAGIDVGQALLIVLIDKNPVQHAQKVIAAGPIYWPVRGQAFARAQDLFHHHVAGQVGRNEVNPGQHLTDMRVGLRGHGEVGGQEGTSTQRQAGAL